MLNTPIDDTQYVPRNQASDTRAWQPTLRHVPIQKRLLAAASTSPSSPGRLVVTAEVAANSMGISLSSAGHVLDTLASVAPREDVATGDSNGGGSNPGGGSSGGGSGGGGGGGGGNPNDEIHVQSLLLYLFLQTYTRWGAVLLECSYDPELETAWFQPLKL
jgi:uncharacterized membrane protein YgcG